MAFDRLFHLFGHKIEGLFKGYLDQVTVFSDEGFIYPILAIKDLNGMISFDAAESLIDRTIGIAFYCHGPIARNTDQKPAPNTAKPARRLFPFNPPGRTIDIFPSPEADSRKKYCSSSHRTLGGSQFDE
jgi:hypothetical protein